VKSGPDTSETCLCLKSYLISGWVRPGQVADGVSRASGSSVTDDTTIMDVVDARRVTSERSSRADGSGHIELAKKMLRNALMSPSLLTTLSKTLIGHSRPLIFIATLTSYL